MEQDHPLAVIFSSKAVIIGLRQVQGSNTCLLERCRCTDGQEIVDLPDPGCDGSVGKSIAPILYKLYIFASVLIINRIEKKGVMWLSHPPRMA
jgi:hypothetical protein